MKSIGGGHVRVACRRLVRCTALLTSALSTAAPVLSVAFLSVAIFSAALSAAALLVTAVFPASALAADAYTAGSEPTSDAGYVGSAECAGCHTQIYDSWWETRHAYSVLTGKEARAAGYPLPAPGGKTGGIRGWQDVSYVVGGRQRIAYADREGRVQDAAYHHRIGAASPFPAEPMTVCGPCHFTGFGSGAAHPDDPALSARFIERNIGCEACHGPGAAHSESLEPEDIAVDASSRVCGSCHTSVGKVLPKDDLHDTHDLIQTWNRDPHVLGVRFQSQNAFCSDCHSPYERGSFSERKDGAATRVFSESKQNITCIGCHDPHALTDPHYRRDEVYLGPPIAPKREVYRGNDEDFTTTDFDRFESTEQVCLDCHRGADRVDLDHANATCNDCHNTFNRNRQPESRPFADANHRRLSCRPCHQDADHLISIVYRDGDFLEPRHVHNLRTLPQAVRARYGFKYPATRPKRWAALPVDPGGLSVAEEMSASAIRDRHVDAEPSGAARVRDLLERGRHAALGSADAKLRALQRTLASDPGALSNHLALARAYALRGEYAVARDVLSAAGDGASPAYRALLFGAGSARPALRQIDRESELLAGEDQDSRAAVTILWLEGLVEMGRGLFQSSAQRLARARAIEPANAQLGLHLGLAHLGLRRYDAAIGTLEEVVDAQPENIASRIALAAIYINYERLGLARDHLLAARVVDPGNTLAAYFLGRAELRLRSPMKAAAAFRIALAGKPEDWNAWFHLARAYRSGGFYGAAVDTYDEIIRRQPQLFDAHRDRARLYKLLSDKVAMTYKRESEKARPNGIGVGEWQHYLSLLEQRSREYGELALFAFDRAQDLRPLDASAMRQKGEIFRRAGQLAKARDQFEWLARAEPSRWLHRYRLGTIAIRQGEHADAVAFLKGALTLAPAEGDVYVALALAYSLTGRVDDAIATLERGSDYEAFNPALYTNLGAAYASRGDIGPALTSLERAVRLRTFPLPRTHLAYTNLGIIHLRRGERADGIQALEKALHVFPEYQHAKRLLADVRSGDARRESSAKRNAALVYDDLLERFGETSTVLFAND